MSTPSSTTSAPGAAPDDADDRRGYHFRELLRSRSTYVWIGLGATLLGLFLALEFHSWTFGGIAAVASLPFGFWTAWKVADGRAAEDFFQVYAKQRHLKLGGKVDLPEATPLLRKGDHRYAERTLTGQLTPEVAGMLATFTVVTEHASGQGRTHKDYHPYTIGMVELPESKPFVSELYCRHREGLRSLDGLEDAFRRSRERVELESEALDRRFEIFAAPGQDENWLRQLFSPSFVVWMTESAPADLAFELAGGTLVVYVRGFKEDTAHLDRMAATTGAVAKRLREESTE